MSRVSAETVLVLAGGSDSKYQYLFTGLSKCFHPMLIVRSRTIRQMESSIDVVRAAGKPVNLHMQLSKL